MRRARSVSWAMACFLAAGSSAGVGAGVAPMPAVAIDIPAQSLDTALLTLSRQARVQIVVANEVARNLTAPAIKGEYSATTALELLLQGLGLIYEVTDEHTIAICDGKRRRACGDPLSTASLGPGGHEPVLAQAQVESPSAADEAASVSDPEGLEEIVVSAEKTERSAKDTATSVSVFTRRMLERTPGIVALSDLAARLPNTNTFGKSGLLPTVRGVDGTGPAIGANAFFAGTRNRLNVQVDGRALGYNEAAYGDGQLWDVAQVEALRGPQSTLQGRNAMGGTIAITTNNPTYDFEGAARLAAGNRDLRQGSISLSGPLVDDQVALRFSADRREYDSFVKMLPTANGIDDPEHYTATTLRGKLLLEPSGWAGFRALFSVTATSFEAPQSEAVGRPFSAHVSNAGDTQEVHKPSSVSGMSTISWAVNERLALENVLSYTDFKFRRFAVVAPARIDGREFVWEPRLHVKPPDGKISGVVGAYYFDSSQSELIDFIGPSPYSDETETKAIFAEFTYAATDRLKLTLGARGEEEHRVRQNSGAAFFLIDLDQTSKVFLPKFAAALALTDATTVGLSVARGYNGGGAGFTFEPPFVNFAFKPEFVWNYELYSRSDINPNLALTANVFYSDYSRMQIPFDLNPDPLINSQIILNADQVVTGGAEVGFRWRLPENWEAHGEVGLLHTNIDASGTRIDGARLARSADITGSMGISHGGSLGLQLSADAQYSGGYFSDEINDPRGHIDPYWTANVQLAYQFERVRLYANVSNLFDSGKPVNIFYGDTAAQDLGILLQPRRFIAGVEVRF